MSIDVVRLREESLRCGVEFLRGVLRDRGLEYDGFFEGRVGYLGCYDLGGSYVTNSLVFFLGGGFVFRSLDTGGYRNMFFGVGGRVYNLSLRRVNVLTEGILDAESFNSVVGDYACGMLGVGFGDRLLHLVCGCTLEVLYLAFDNDSVGIRCKRRVLEFVGRFYGDLRCVVLDFPCKDLNEFLVRFGRVKFSEVIRRGLL